MSCEAETHTSEPLPLREAPRCGANTRSGKQCRSPAVGGKQRCRMHGGARGSGGPCGDRNGNYRHGRYSKEHEAKVQPLRQFMSESKELTRMLRSPSDRRAAVPAAAAIGREQ
jgi:hypothetical protein